jgi:hypothetical protein
MTARTEAEIDAMLAATAAEYEAEDRMAAAEEARQQKTDLADAVETLARDVERIRRISRAA